MHFSQINHVCIAFQVATAITPYFVGVYYILKGINFGGKIAIDKIKKYLQSDNQPKVCEFNCNSCSIYKFVDNHLIKLRKQKAKMELEKAIRDVKTIETGHEYIIHPSPMGVPNPPRIFSRVPSGIVQIMTPNRRNILSPPKGLESIISAKHDKFKLNSAMKEKFQCQHDENESSEEEIMSIHSDSWDDLVSMDA